MGKLILTNAQKRDLPVIIPFFITIFLSAFLLFQVQPLISRFILPWFGGTPAVWSTSLLFFQSLLMGGYAFAHWLSANKKWQLQLYLVLLFFSFLMLLVLSAHWGSPLLPDDRWKPVTVNQPLLRIITILLVSVGLPYFLLSSTSPLLQSWLKFFNPKRTPFRLYALSNFGSFLGLISYPFLFEPLFRLNEQAWIWSVLYLIFIIFCGFIGWQVLKRQTRKQPQEMMSIASKTSTENSGRDPTLFRKVLWVMLAACSSILLISVTNQLTQEVAVIPFLWVLPLSIYLFSFIISFSGEKWYPRMLFISLLAISTFGAGYALRALTTTGLFYQILILVLFLFFATFVLHGELYRIRPGSKDLTAFYLYISLGGVIGGIFVNLVAPIIFKGYWELHLGILILWLLILLLQLTQRPSIFDRKRLWEAFLPILLILAAGGYLLFDNITQTTSGVLNMQRNFYGVLRVRLIGIGDPLENAYALNHGSTSHGFQFQDVEKRSIPTAYYGEQSGIGLAIKNYKEASGNYELAQQGLKVGLIGLGTGTLAAYGQNEDNYRFYEINQDIVDLALGQDGYFTYLSDSPANIEIVIGDARISLESERNREAFGNFDILAVDAFSSDAIPVHLLTVEAVGLYLAHLKPEGVLAIHISNRYLNLAPLVESLAEYYQLDHAMIRNAGDKSNGSYASTWMLLSKNKVFFELPEIRKNNVSTPENQPDVRIWTDDYSNLLPLIKMKEFTTIQ